MAFPRLPDTNRRYPSPARQALDALVAVAEDVMAVFVGVTPTADPRDVAEIEALFDRGVAALDAELAGTQPQELTALRTAARETAANLAQYVDDQPNGRAAAASVAARMISRRLLRADENCTWDYESASWGVLVWELHRAYAWMRGQMTADEAADHGDMPWPELEIIESAVGAVVDR